MPSIAELNALAEDMQRQRDEEYFRNHPWEKPTTIVADMFGDVRDNPMVRAARELQFDRAVADETAKVRLANKAPWETSEGILKEIYSPLAASIAASRGIAPGEPVKQKNRLTTYKTPGGGVIGVDPGTREVVRLTEDAPPKPTVEKPVPWLMERGMFGSPDLKVTLPPSAFAEQFGKMPEFARTNDFNRIQLQGHGYDFGTNGLPRKIGANPFAEGVRMTAGTGTQATAKKLDEATARVFLKNANGDRNKARQLAKAAGYEF